MIAAFPIGRFLFGLLILIGLATFAVWFFWWSLRKSDDPVRVLFRVGLTLGVIVVGYFMIDRVAGKGDPQGQIAGVILGLFFGLILAVLWTPVIAGHVGDAFASLFSGGREPPKPEPVYSIAQARIKQGRMSEAVAEIRRQLELFPTDVTGHLLLAQVQAEHLDDLPAARLTIERLSNQPGHSAAHLAGAWNAVADWYLRVQALEEAQSALEQILTLAPDTEQARAAAQRIAHLPTSAALQAANEQRPITLPRGRDDIGLMVDSASLRPAEKDPVEATRELVRHLQQHPQDNEAREKLAMLYLEHYGRLELAMDQFETLVATPHQSGRDIARWLNRMADLQIQNGADYDTVRQTLERLIERFSGLAAAELARQRLEHLRLEFKGKQQAQAIQLGTYEKDLGLKPGRPKGS